MPTFRVTSPDGRTFRVNAPEGATQEEAIAYVQAQQQATSAAQAQPEPEDPGALMAGVIGAGRVADKTVSGIQQAYYGLRGDQDALARLKTEQEAADKAYSGLQKVRPVATTVGEIAPLIAALPAVGSVAGAAALGALPGALEYGSPEERASRAALGAAGGAAGAELGKLVGRVAQPFRPQPSEVQAGAQAAASRLGVQLRPSEIVQSRPLGWMEAALNDLPFSGGMAQTQEAARRSAINQAGARSIGKTGPEITEAMLAQARADIGGTFDSLLANRRIELGPQFRADIANIVDSKVMPSLRDDSIEAVLAPFKNLPAGKVKVSGEWFQQNKTALDAAIRSAYNTPGQAGKAQALEAFEDALLKAAKSSMSGAERKAFETAQKQWANLRMLETGKVVEGGNIMPGRLDSALGTRYKGAYKEGRIAGELPDIGKLGQVYKPLPQSGTTPRALYSGMAGGALFAEPVTAATMMAAPPLMQKFLQSEAGRKYLTQGLLQVTPEMERRLMQGGFGLLGAPLAAEAY